MLIGGLGQPTAKLTIGVEPQATTARLTDGLGPQQLGGLD
jgi:hypothetical protein